MTSRCGCVDASDDARMIGAADKEAQGAIGSGRVRSAIWPSKTLNAWDSYPKVDASRGHPSGYSLTFHMPGNPAASMSGSPSPRGQNIQRGDELLAEGGRNPRTGAYWVADPPADVGIAIPTSFLYG